MSGHSAGGRDGDVRGGDGCDRSGRDGSGRDGGRRREQREHGMRERRIEIVPRESWHVDFRLGEDYAHGVLSESSSWSVEKHLEGCGMCAASVSQAVGRTSAAPVLADVRAALLSATAESATKPAARRVPHAAASRVFGSRTPPEPYGPRAARPRMLGRFLWSAGPALRGSWLVALLLVCAGAVVLAYGLDAESARPLLLAFAPLLPLAGVALSYGPRADPLYEVAAATPSGGLRLLLTRTLIVLGVSLPLLTAVGAFLPEPPGVPSAAAWLLPGLALTLCTLALSSYVGCRLAAGAVASAWCFAVLLPLSRESGEGMGEPVPLSVLVDQLTTYFSGPAAQGMWAVAATLCAGLLVLRRHAFDHAVQQMGK